MSTDWNIHCVDCKSTLTFADANHQDALMVTLISHAGAIATLAPLLRECRDEVKLDTYWGRIDADWFADHIGHKLVPISEYGDLLTQCHAYVECVCGSTRRCARDRDHDGAHAVEP